MNTINHHPTVETLQSFAAGHLQEACVAIIATHLELCSRCNRDVRDLDAIGGVCLENITPVQMQPNALELFWEKASLTLPARQPASIRAHNDFRAELAQPLSHYIDGNLDSVKWRKIAPGISHSVLEVSDPRPNSLRLLKINSNVKIPAHTHKNNELTLILRGAYEDEIGVFSEGDLADLNSGHNHSPKAIGDEPCICLIATTGPLEFKDIFSRALQPFIGL